jgi:(R,R)-butanediol dehydrogenase/meso-butanediol dehydrogenase/diacetyl reductase
MKAAVWHGRGDVRIELVPAPAEPRTGEALIEVARCGLCGSDRREFDEGPVLIPRTPHPLTGLGPPLVLGHEISGRVVAVGDDHARGLVGRRVAVDPTRSCGSCDACRRGDRHLCRIAACLGVSCHGGLAAKVLAPVDGLVPVPDGVSDDEAALAEPLAVALHAVDRAALRLGERVVITGFGPIGAGVMLAARAAGASEIVVVEPNMTRRSWAAGLGATVVDPGQGEEPSEELRALWGAADLGFECSGASKALTTTVRSTRAGGRVVVPAVSHGVTGLSMRSIVLGERAVIGTVGYRGDIARAVRLVEHGVIDVGQLVSQVMPLSAVPRWFSDPASAATSLKVLVDPQPAGPAPHG